MFIDQAIFTSARTGRLEGYHLVAASPGISEAEAVQLAQWSPAHGALLADDLPSVNFHPVGDRWCVSQTVAAGEEYSERGGARVYTHVLVLTRNDFARFANNAWAVWQAAQVAQRFEPVAVAPPKLSALALPGRAVVFDQPAIWRLEASVGANGVAQLLDTALEGGPLLLETEPRLDVVLPALLNLLPLGCRTLGTFTTGLRHSPRRPFLWQPCPPTDSAAKVTAKQSGASLFSFANDTVSSRQIRHPYALLVRDVLQSGGLASFARAFGPLTVSNFAELATAAASLRGELRNLPVEVA